MLNIEPPQTDMTESYLAMQLEQVDESLQKPDTAQPPQSLYVVHLTCCVLFTDEEPVLPQGQALGQLQSVSIITYLSSDQRETSHLCHT